MIVDGIVPFSAPEPSSTAGLEHPPCKQNDIHIGEIMNKLLHG